MIDRKLQKTICWWSKRFARFNEIPSQLTSRRKTTL